MPKKESMPGCYFFWSARHGVEASSCKGLDAVERSLNTVGQEHWPIGITSNQDIQRTLRFDHQRLNPLTNPRSRTLICKSRPRPVSGNDDRCGARGLQRKTTLAKGFVQFLEKAPCPMCKSKLLLDDVDRPRVGSHRNPSGGRDAQ